LKMYVGRIVIVGRSGGRSFAGYRVSSRSFPNRRAEVRDRGIMVSPLDARDLAKNPYIAYNCIRVWRDAAVVANGTQADMIVEKIEDGTKPLEALSFSLMAYGYERDELDTPRLAGAVRGNRAWLGIAKKDEIRCKELSLREGTAFMVATYEKTEFEPLKIEGMAASDIAKAAYDLSFERPVCSAAAVALPDGKDFEMAVYNPM
jgi:IMP cyclohydrolase